MKINTTKTPQKETLGKKNLKETHEKPQIKVLDMNCSQRPDWTCGPCSVFAKDSAKELS